MGRLSSFGIADKSLNLSKALLGLLLIVVLYAATPNLTEPSTSNAYEQTSETGKCFLQRDNQNYEERVKLAFSIVTQEELPRAYYIGYETFLKNNPDYTLYIYGNIKEVDPRFKENGFDVRLFPLDVFNIMEKLKEKIPEMEAVFSRPAWKDVIFPLMQSTPMVLADFMRYGLLYLHGGSWIDADAIYLRPFTLSHALPCHQYFPAQYIQCKDDKTLNIPFNPHRPPNYESDFYCTNGILGGFSKEDPFLKKLLLRIGLIPTSDTFITLGGHLISSSLINSAPIGETPRENQLAQSEWPNFYRLERLFGFFQLPDYVRNFQGNVTAMKEDLARREVFSVQLYHDVALVPERLHTEFADGTLYRTLWQDNCVFSCHEYI